MKIKPVFKINNSKHLICSWIIEHFPKNYHELNFIEPFCGGASVFFNKNKSKVEVLNDINLKLIRIFQALRDEPEFFLKKIKNLTLSERVFNREVKKSEFEDYIEEATNELILRVMSRGGMKKTLSSTTAINTNNLDLISKRLEEVILLNKPATVIIEAFNEKDTICYCDPPVLDKDPEMNLKQHIELADVLNKFTGKALISGESSPLYNRLYKDWKCVKKTFSNKKEVIWLNY